jgi:hypothetical protein
VCRAALVEDDGFPVDGAQKLVVADPRVHERLADVVVLELKAMALDVG